MSEDRISRRDSLLKLGGLLAGATAVGGWKVAEEAGAGPAGVSSGLVACVLAPEQTEGPCNRGQVLICARSQVCVKSVTPGSG